MVARKSLAAVRKSAPRRVKSAGERLVAELSKPKDPFAITIMITEAGRVADRLDKLDALVTGKKSAWMYVRVNTDDVLEVFIDKALQEARQQTAVLIRLLAQIHRQRADIPGPDPDDDLDGL